MKRKKLSPTLIGAALAGVCAIILIIVAAMSPRAPENPTGAVTKPKLRPLKTSERTGPNASKLRNSESFLVDDDGKTLWASPTDGEPINLAYLPPGVQVIFVLRANDLSQHAEGEKVRDALGPLGQRGVQWIQDTLHAPLEEIERLVVGCQAMSDGGWQTTLVAHFKPSAPHDVVSKLADGVEKAHGGDSYHVAGERAYFAPSRANGAVLVVAPVEAMADIIDLAGEPPPLRRDVERLIAHTDADRHVTIIVAPNSLFSEGQSMFAGTMAGLRQPLFWFLGDELSAAALSLHWDENFFLELIAMPTLDTSAERAARILSERLAEVPNKLEQHVVALDASPHSRLLVARFPGMIRKLSAYTRSGFDADHAVLRCYLPAIAGHNLIMAAELTLAEQTGTVDSVADATAPTPDSAPDAASVRERLQQKTSLRFARETLEAALEQLALDIGVTIEIRGPDLQAEGITKNQSFGIDLADRPAEEILVEILRLANPDKTAASAKDEKQKLVYVVAPSADGSEGVFVTTRVAAAARGDELPAVFKPE